MLQNTLKKKNIKKDALRPVMLVDDNAMVNYQACLQHLFVGLAEESYQSVLICPPNSKDDNIVCPYVERIDYLDLKIPFIRSQNRRAVLERLIKFKPTVLNCFSLSKAGVTQYLAEQLDIPFLLTFDSCQWHNIKWHNIKDVVYSPNCMSLLALSANVATGLEKRFSKFNGTIKQINAGTFVEDTGACFSTDHVSSLIVAQPFLDPDVFTSLLKAVRHLAVDGYEFVLALIGKGPAERHIHKVIKSLNLGQIVTIVPEIQPLRSIFAGADIFIRLQSRPEFNPTLLEAMGVGMAVAACQDGEDDFLIDKETALCFDAYDELNTYSTLKKLLDDHESARQIASKGQEYLRENHTVTQMINTLLQAYNDAQKRYKKQQAETDTSM